MNESGRCRHCSFVMWLVTGEERPDWAGYWKMASLRTHQPSKSVIGGAKLEFISEGSGTRGNTTAAWEIGASGPAVSPTGFPGSSPPAMNPAMAPRVAAILIAMGFFIPGSGGVGKNRDLRLKRVDGQRIRSCNQKVFRFLTMPGA